MFIFINMKGTIINLYSQYKHIFKISCDRAIDYFLREIINKIVTLPNCMNGWIKRITNRLRKSGTNCGEFTFPASTESHEKEAKEISQQKDSGLCVGRVRVQQDEVASVAALAILTEFQQPESNHGSSAPACKKYVFRHKKGYVLVMEDNAYSIVLCAFTEYEGPRARVRAVVHYKVERVVKKPLSKEEAGDQSYMVAAAAICQDMTPSILVLGTAANVAEPVCPKVTAERKEWSLHLYKCKLCWYSLKMFVLLS